MATEPSFFSDGYTPRRTDTRRLRWIKILGFLQSQAAALAANNPRRDDTLREIKVKICKALQSI